MTACDLIKRLEEMMKTKKIERTAQIYISPNVNSAQGAYLYFDIIMHKNDVVLVPSDKWNKPETKQKLVF